MKIWALFQQAHLVDHFVFCNRQLILSLVLVLLPYTNMVTTTSYGMYIRLFG